MKLYYIKLLTIEENNFTLSSYMLYYIIGVLLIK